MQRHKCTVCGWIYDPAIGVKAQFVEPGTPFENVPDDFQCPQCGSEKRWFEPMG